MLSKAFLRAGFAATFVLCTSGLAAAPLRVTGAVRGEAGAVSTAQNVQVELYPAYESYAGALRRLTEKQAPVPLAKARVGAGGTYEVLAPEKGCFRVVVRAEGYLPVEIPFLSLVDHQELPTAPLVRSLPVEVRTTGPDGRPLAGIEVRVPPSSPLLRATQSELSLTWQVADLRAVSDGEGRVSIPWNHFEGTPAVVSLSPRFLGQSMAAVSEDAVNLRLSPTWPVRIEVRDSRDQPVSQALVRWGGVPIAVTGQDGRLEIAIPKDGPPLTAESREGEQARINAARVEGDEVFPVRLAPPRRISGQAVDAKTRKPVPRALVWNGRPLAAAPVIAGKDGTFEISLPSWAAETLEGEAPAYEPGESRIAGKAPQERVVLPLPPTIYIVGQVIDRAERPVPGTLIVAHPPRIRRGVPEPISARSAEDGRFVLRGLLPNGTYWLTFTRQGFSRMTVQARTHPTGKARPVRFTLDPGPVVKGRLVDEGGQSVAGAEVVLSLQPADESFEEEAQWSAVSDAAGRFSFGRAGTGFFSLKAVHPDHADLYMPGLEIAGGEPDVDLGTFTLAAGGTLEGTVTGAGGKPVEGAEVEIKPYDIPWGPELNVRTGPDGVFRARGLRPRERFSVKAWQRGYVPESQGPLQLPTEAPVRIELKPVRSLSGQVVGSEGEPVAEAAVLGRLEWRYHQALGNVRGVTDAEGQFRLEGLHPGSISLYVSADGYMNHRLSQQIPEGGDLKDVKIVLERSRVVEARVLDAAGEPVADATVRALNEDFFSEPCRTDLQGRCRLQTKAGRSCRVTAQRQAYSATSEQEAGASAVELPPGTGETQVELYLPGSTEVSGRVLGGDGRGVPGTAIYVQAVPGGYSSVWTDADGSFLIPKVPDGRYRLTTRRNKALAEVEITVEGQPVQGVELRLGPEETEATLSGRLLGVAPADLPQVWVIAEDHHNPNLVGRIDSRGTYRISGLYPGEWTLGVEAPNGKLWTKFHIAPGQTEATLDLEIPSYRFVAGRVLLEGEPLAGASVEISKGKEKWLTGTGPDGTFWHRFIDSSGNSAGLYRIKAEKEGIAPAEVSVAIPEGGSAPPVEIHLKGAP